MMLARQQVQATARHHQLFQQYYRMVVEDRGPDGGQEDPMTEDRKLWLEMEGVRVFHGGGGGGGGEMQGAATDIERRPLTAAAAAPHISAVYARVLAHRARA